MNNAKNQKSEKPCTNQKNGDFYMEILSTLNWKSDAIFTNPPFSTELADLDQRFSIFDFCCAKRKKSEIYVLEDL